MPKERDATDPAPHRPSCSQPRRRATPSPSPRRADDGRDDDRADRRGGLWRLDEIGAGRDAAHPAGRPAGALCDAIGAQRLAAWCARPADAQLQLPPGFAVTPFVTGLDGPRQMRLAPNGDIFLAESGAKRIRVIRAAAGAATAETPSVFADGPRIPALRHRLLSARPRARISSMSRPKDRCCAFPTRPATWWRAGKPEVDRARRAGRPSLDARHHLHARRQAAAARGRIGRQ